jgi:F-type H+-transporting ATPase subunit epsilon
MAHFDKLRLSVVTPRGEVFTDEVDMVVIPGAEGQLGILPNHSPLFTNLSHGELSIKKGEETTPMAVAGGFAEVVPGKVTILTDMAVRAGEIDVLKAEEARRRAERLMEEKRSERDFAAAEASLKRALLELKVAKKYRRPPEP